MKVYLLLILFLSGCAAPDDTPTKAHVKDVEQVEYSWYGYLHKQRELHSWHWYLEEQVFETKLQLRPITVTPDSLYIRYSTDMGQIVEVWTADGSFFNGLMTSWADTFDVENSDNWLWKIRFKKDKLDTALARKVYDGLKGIRAIPTCSAIKEWHRGFMDGVAYGFEIGSRGTFDEKSYWCPYAQPKDVAAARAIIKIIESVDRTLNFRRRYDEFFYTLPRGMFRTQQAYYLDFALMPDDGKACKKAMKNRTPIYRVR